MRMRIFGERQYCGTGTALATPFCDGGRRIDYAAMKNLLERQIEGGVDFLVLMGTTGEAPTISREERRAFIAFTVEVADERIPVVVGAGNNDTRATVELCGEARELGADAVLISTPYYNKPTQEGLYQHFAACTEAGLPVILYNVPGRTGVNLEAATVERLAELPGIVGVKEASGNLGQVDDIITRTSGRDDFSVLSGNDDQTFHIISSGGHGVISVLSNVVPAETAALVNAARAGDIAEARRLHHRLTPLVRSLFVETNPIPVKHALSALGLCENTMRLPLTAAGSRSVSAVDSALESLGLGIALVLGETACVME